MVANDKSNEKKEEYKRLPWYCCNCGCKGYAVSLDSLHNWHYWLSMNPEGDGKYHLYKGHGSTLSDNIGNYDSFDDADRSTRENATRLLRVAMKQLQQVEVALR